MKMVADGQEELAHELRERADDLVVLESCVLIFIIFMAFAGDSMVCLAVYRSHRLRTITNMYVVSLALLDALLVVLCGPFSIVLLTTGEWPFGSGVCNFHGFFIFFCCLLSLFLVTATAVNRYFRVVKPDIYRRWFKAKSTCLSIVLITLLAVFGAVLPPLAQWATFELHYGRAICFLRFETRQLQMGYMAFLDVFWVAIPIGIISFSYYKSFQTIKGHNQVMNATRQGAILSVNVEEVKITKALFAAVLGLSFCWVPIAFVDIVESFTTLVIPRHFFLMYMYLGYSSCFINPFIYGVMNRAFRAEFLRVFAFCSKSVVVAANSSTPQICRSATKTHRLACEQV